MGTSPYVYWGINLLFDMLLFFLTVLVCLAMFAAFDNRLFSGDNTSSAICLFVVHSFAAISLQYLLTFVVSKPVSLQVFSSIFIGIFSLLLMALK
jgi:hypothetical protein